MPLAHQCLVFTRFERLILADLNHNAQGNPWWHSLEQTKVSNTSEVGRWFHDTGLHMRRKTETPSRDQDALAGQLLVAFTWALPQLSSATKEPTLATYIRCLNHNQLCFLQIPRLPLTTMRVKLRQSSPLKHHCNICQCHQSTHGHQTELQPMW